MTYRYSILFALAAAAAAQLPATALADDQVVDDDEPPARLFAEAPSSAPFVAHDWAVELNLGLGTPNGLLAVSRDLHLDDSVGARVSVGLGTIAFTPYISQPLGPRTELRLSGGVKGGLAVWREQGGWCFSDDCASKRSWTTAFGIAELSLMYHVGSSFFVKPYVGAAAALNPDSLQCTGGDEAVVHCMSDHAADGHRRIYGGMALGASW